MNISSISLYNLSYSLMTSQNDVTTACLLVLKEQCRETNHQMQCKQCQNKTYLIQIPQIQMSVDQLGYNQDNAGMDILFYQQVL